MTYGIDLVDFVAGRLPGKTPRLLLCLLERLPEGSELHAELAGGREFRDWSRDSYMLATLIDAVNTNTLATGFWDKGKKPKFEPVERPGDKLHKKQKVQSLAGGGLKALRNRLLGLKN